MKIGRNGWNSVGKRPSNKILKSCWRLTAEIIRLLDEKEKRLMHRAPNQ